MGNSVRYLGCHVSAAGGLANALKNGKELGVNTIQIHPTPPQRWNFQPFKENIEQEYLDKLSDSGVKKVFFHAIYLINLATPDTSKLKQAVQSLRYYLELMDRIKGDGVVVHVGSNKDQEREEDGFQQASDAINEVFKDLSGESRLLLEVAAGSGKVIGANMSDLRKIYDNVDNKDRLGFALDTQHMWASGYDIKDHADDVITEIESTFGMERVHLIHLNDSKSDLASRVDRHENLGQGKITADGLAYFINHPKIRSIPIILETPAMKDIESAKEEFAVLQEMAK